MKLPNLFVKKRTKNVFFENASERTDMQQRVDPILRKYHTDMYICGHIHNFQHIKPANSTIDYIVNSAASLARDKVKPIEGTIFTSGQPGFLYALEAVSNQHNTDKRSGTEISRTMPCTMAIGMFCGEVRLLTIIGKHTSIEVTPANETA